MVSDTYVDTRPSAGDNPNLKSPRLFFLNSFRCGLRCGYVELVNLDPSLKDYIYKLFSKDSCAPVLGQIAMDLMTNPPQPGDPSYSLYEAVSTETHSPVYSSSLISLRTLTYMFTARLQEIRAIRDTVTDNVKRASAVFNSLPCVSHHPVNGGAFLFPKIDLPTKAVQKAKVVKLNKHQQAYIVQQR